MYMFEKSFLPLFFFFQVFITLADADSRLPDLPLSVPNPKPPVITQVVTVLEGQDLQAALTAATPGTNIDCEGTFVGNFYIPGVSSVELSGNCILRSPNTYPAFMNISATEGFGWTGNIADRAAQNWWISGITIETSGPIYHAVVISNDCDPTPQGMPSGITFSNVTVNGLYMQDGQQNGMLLDGENISLLDSEITQWQSSGILNTEANAVTIICGTGPYLFQGRVQRRLLHRGSGSKPYGAFQSNHSERHHFRGEPSDERSELDRNPLWTGQELLGIQEFRAGADLRQHDRELFSRSANRRGYTADAAHRPG
jgi:hypothetical protein